MSLPPLTQFNRNEPKKPSKCLYYKFSTANTQKLMNPILSVNLKKIKPGVTLSKACDVMSSVPPPNLNLSKFSISRLSPVLPSLQPPTKKTARGYLKRKYIDYLEIDRKSEFSVNFDKPIRDYFQETLDFQDTSPKFASKLEVINISPFSSGLMGKDQKYLKPKYCSVVMPLPRDAEKIVSKELKNQKEKKREEREKIKRKIEESRVIHQSLQTDTNSFEFDEWEFDYEA